MPSWTVMVTLFLLASIAGLCWVLVLAQRQFAVPDADRPADARSGSRGLGGSVEQRIDALAARMAARALAGSEVAARPAPSSLPQIITASIESAAKVQPRNSAEARAAGTLRAALAQALQGQFGVEVRTVVEGVEGVQSWHDIRKLSAEGVTIDHLAVGPRGVFVIDSVVRPAPLSLDADQVYVGRPPDRSPDPMIGEILDKVAAVAALVEPAPVQGVIVLEDSLTLPSEIRHPGATVRGVQLTTVSGLPARLTTGLPLAAAVDVEAIWARLFPAFGPAIDSPDHPFAATAPAPDAGPLGVAVPAAVSLNR